MHWRDVGDHTFTAKAMQRVSYRLFNVVLGSLYHFGSANVGLPCEFVRRSAKWARTQISVFLLTIFCLLSMPPHPPACHSLVILPPSPSLPLVCRMRGE